LVRFFGSGTVGSGAGVSFPVGSMMLYGGTTSPPPVGWLLCDGQAINRITFASLFAVIGVLYGVGDGSTTFNVPDFRTSQSFPRGATNDAGRGTTGGLNAVTLVEAELPAHNHPITPDPHEHQSQVRVPPGGASGLSGVGAVVANVGPTSLTSAMTGGDGSHENQPPFQDVNYIIHV